MRKRTQYWNQGISTTPTTNIFGKIKPNTQNIKFKRAKFKATIKTELSRTPKDQRSWISLTNKVGKQVYISVLRECNGKIERPQPFRYVFAGFAYRQDCQKQFFDSVRKWNQRSLYEKQKQSLDSLLHALFTGLNYVNMATYDKLMLKQFILEVHQRIYHIRKFFRDTSENYIPNQPILRPKSRLANINSYKLENKVKKPVLPNLKYFKSFIQNKKEKFSY